MLDIMELLEITIKEKASDLHLSAGANPLFRIHGEIKQTNVGALSGDEVKKMVYSIMPESVKKVYEEKLEVDFAFEVPNLSRFRVNAFMQRRGPAAVFRTIPTKILSLEDLGAPQLFADLMSKPKGLILVTGATGSGKSTTLAAMIDYYNKNFSRHVLTVEDPIEFVHPPQKCLINQREVGTQTLSFQAALKSALREDPDLILVGEMRDLETIRLALTAAETGHLVLGTLHSSSAAKTINRIIDVFPENEKETIKVMLSESIEAIISQNLLPKKDGGRVACHEIMVGIDAIRNLIREGKIAQMYTSIQTGQRVGMQTMDQGLAALVRSGKITTAEAKLNAVRPDQFN
jgi:twitching motility protein PilT